MAGKAQKAGKSKRPQSDRQKARRARSRASAAQRHEVRAREQERCHQRNLKGDLTPWQQACAERAARRDITCGKDGALFEDGRCPQCGGTLNLKAAWQKRNTQLVA